MALIVRSDNILIEGNEGEDDNTNIEENDDYDEEDFEDEGVSYYDHYLNGGDNCMLYN